MNISNLCFCRTIYKTATTFLGQENSKSNVLLSLQNLKVHIYWEGHKILQNLHRRFLLCSNGQIYSGDFTKFFGFSEYINFKIINRKKDKNICRILSYLRNWTVIIGYKDCMCNQLIMRKIAARVIKLKLIPPSLILQTLAVYTHFFLSRLKF